MKRWMVLLLFLSASISHAATDRIALIIGNSKYEDFGVLSNTLNDAKRIDSTLKEMGYQTRLVLDGTEANLRKEIKRFAADADGASLALVFYAGHGAQVNGENYLLPMTSPL